MLEVLAELNFSYLHSSLLPQEHLLWKAFKVFLSNWFGKKKCYQSWEQRFGLIPFTMYVDVSVYVCGRWGGRRGKCFQLADGFSSGWKKHLKSMEPGWVTTAEDLGQAAAMLCRAVVWRNPNRAVQTEKLKEMFGGRTSSFHVWRTAVQLWGAMPGCLQIHWICAVSLSFVSQIRAIAFSECLRWVLSEACLLLCICSWGWQMKWLNIAVGSSVTKSGLRQPVRGHEKPLIWSRPQVDKVCCRQTLQVCFPFQKNKKRESPYLTSFWKCVWNKVKLGSFWFLCVQIGLQWKGIIIKVSVLVVILQAFYFKCLPPECIKIERHHLIARSMEVNKSVACKRLMKRRQLLFQVFWNGENSGLES